MKSNNKKKLKKYEVRPWVGDTITEHLLHARGIIKPEEKEAFLNPDYDKHVHDPFLMKDMDIAVKRIMQAIDNNEKIVIYGDFDADGIPASVILHDFFKKISYTNFVNYIPHRHKEGFGFHVHVVEGLAEENLANGQKMLIITLDCGITDIETVKKANENNIDVIITDHHLPLETLPPAVAVLDPKRLDCSYPDKMLCGAGVAFKLVQALILNDRNGQNRFNIKEGWEKWLLDLVGIATLSDMVPLVNENRVFAKYGLLVLKKTQRIGLVKLFRELKISTKDLVEEDVTFLITPRINAASRMADPRDAFVLLSTTSPSEAEEMVKHLNSINDERKTIVAKTSKEIHKIIRDLKLNQDNVIVVGNPDWSPALLGLVATSLVKDYGVPVFLWGRSEGMIKGSCRSDGFCDVVSVLRDAQDKNPNLFINAGGHAFSGGFSINESEIHEFRDKIKESFDGLYKENLKEISYMVDASLLPNQINWQFWNGIDKLAPFGEGNSKPLFAFHNVLIKEIKMFGKKKEHLEIAFSAPGESSTIKAIQFFAEEALFDELDKALKSGEEVTRTILGNMEKSTFTYTPVLRVRIVDVL